MLVGLLVTSTSFSQTKWTLKHCLEHAASKNIQIKQAELLERISKNNLIQSKTNFLPTASTDANYNFTFGNSIDPTSYRYINSNSQSLTFGLSSNLTIFNGLQKVHTVYRNKADYEAAAFDKANTINSTALQLTNLFLQVLLNKELKTISAKQLEISQEQLTKTKSQIQSGILAETAIYEFEAQVARDNASLIQASNNVDVSLLQLKIALQLPENQAFDIEAPTTNIVLENIANTSASEIYKIALYNQPSIKSAQAKIASAIFTKKLAWGTLSPTLSATFSLRDNYFNKATNIVSISPYVTEPVGIETQLKNNLTKVAGFSFSMPILYGGSRVNNIANAKLQQQIKELELDNQKNKLQQDVLQAYNNARVALENMLANEKARNAAQKSLEVVEKRFGVGLSNSFELQQIRTNFIRSESQYLQSKYSYLLNLKVLDFYKGLPITLED